MSEHDGMAAGLAAGAGSCILRQAEEIAALTARIAELEGALAWVGQVHPDKNAYGSSRINIEGGHAIHLTWDEWNKLREVLGLKLQKPIHRAALRGKEGE